MSEPACIVSSGFGIYIPQVWAERYGAQAAETAGVRREHVNVLLLGPHLSPFEEYDYAWERVLDDYCHTVDNVDHFLYQDGDLYEVPETFDMENWS